MNQLELHDERSIGPLQSLINRGLIIATAGDTGRLNYTERDAEPEDHATEVRVPLALVASAIAEQALAAAELKIMPAHRIIGGLRRQKRQRRSTLGGATNDLLVRAGAFRASSKFYSNDGRCLHRSIALARHLVRRGYAVDLVVGVQLSPFTAHCWVEHNRVVLNDRLEAVRAYSPILVI